MKRGAKTNRSGKPLEYALEQLIQNGFAQYNGQQFDSVSILPNRYFCTHSSYITIYGTQGYHEGFIVADGQNGTDFLSDIDQKIRVIVECKFQSTSGSTDEKIPYVIENFLCSEIRNWILLLNGPWFTKARGLKAFKYAKMRALDLSNLERRLLVVTRKEFADLIFHAWGRSNHG